MRVVGDVKCYHCGHVSGQIEGERTDRLVLHTFRPRPGYRGPLPQPGQRIRCERCGGPVFLEDLQPVFQADPIALPTTSTKRKRPKPPRPKAA
jgi:DNA-directed RNA polymerase subunit RPC12/RpoP